MRIESALFCDTMKKGASFVSKVPMFRNFRKFPKRRRENHMVGIITAIVAGAAMSFQGVMNTRLGDKIGLYESNVFVQGTAFVLAVIAMLILGKGDIMGLMSVDNKIYLLGGVLGLVITVTVMLAIGNLSPTYAISIILISQLIVAALVDAFGWLGSEKIPFTWNKYVGVGLMIAGVVCFKWKS